MRSWNKIAEKGCGKDVQYSITAHYMKHNLLAFPQKIMHPVQLIQFSSLQCHSSALPTVSWFQALCSLQGKVHGSECRNVHVQNCTFHWRASLPIFSVCNYIQKSFITHNRWVIDTMAGDPELHITHYNFSQGLPIDKLIYSDKSDFCRATSTTIPCSFICHMLLTGITIILL